MEVRGQPGHDDDTDLHAKHRVPGGRLSIPGGGDIPDPCDEEHGVSGPLDTPEGSCDPFGRVTAEGSHGREEPGDDDLAANPDGRGQNVKGQSDGIHGVGQRGE